MISFWGRHFLTAEELKRERKRAAIKECRLHLRRLVDKQEFSKKYLKSRIRALEIEKSR